MSTELTETSQPIGIPIDPADKPIVIGGRTIPTRFFLAPLAGFTHLSFRLAIRELGGLGLATTDLVLADSILARGKRAVELTRTCPEDTPMAVQIYGGKTEHLVEAAKFLEDQNYKSIDINMGCPMAKITGNGGGARLMCDTDNACQLVSLVVNAVDIPVTVKMRLGWDSENITAPALAREFEQQGVKAITIHGRTREQGFHGEISVDGIRDTVEAVDNIPVVGNGDVRNPADAYRLMEMTGCAAVAIGRGALFDPWIFRKIDDYGAGREPREPDPEELIQFLIRHFYLMVDQHAQYSCIMFRKFSAWYGAKLGVPEDLEDRLRKFNSYSEFDEIVEQIRERQGERESSVPTAMLKIPNGPIAHW
ncbi:tRNA-dihydrouridine synthase C [Polystyrenella longa]|uniref:tRNA-dihydrouridine synthase n=1 Tax=Polystyrenella longa TaxID=2528007 RepID=A0A518CRW6_9PLAN|nr:tRNA-dihydrouridine synthase [Polystyrenella longa]QDU81958.1 tRNA-dihydrouridine synthase C [Polystyrenella longa]